MKIQTSLSLLCIFLVVACGEANTNQSPHLSTHTSLSTAKAEAWTVKPINQEWQTRNCNREGQPCLEVIVNYPQFKGDNNAITKIINQVIKQQVINVLGNYRFSENPNPKLPDLETVVQELFLDFNQQIEPNSVLANHWMIEINGKQASATPRTVTMSISEYSYLGGAHPNSRQTYLNFNKKTGQLIQIEDFIANKELLLNLAEQKFREAYNLTPAQDLTAAGLFENQLVLPQNFAITQEGLRLFYNTYEIGPYAAGTYEVNLPWTRLEDVLKENSIIDPDFLSSFNDSLVIQSCLSLAPL